MRSTTAAPAGLASPCYATRVLLGGYRGICGRSSLSAESRATSATAKSCKAKPVESKRVISAGDRRLSATPMSTSPICATSARVDCSRLDGGGQLASVARLFPVVAEDAPARELLDRDLRLAGAVCAHQAHVLARPQRARRQQHLASRRHGREQVGCERLLARCDRPPTRRQRRAREPRRDPRRAARARARRRCAQSLRR